MTGLRNKTRCGLSAPRAMLIAAGLCAAALAASGGAIAEARRTPVMGRPAEAAPVPHRVWSRSAPLAQSRTRLAGFETAPFPYNGWMPGKDKPFHDIVDGDRRGHSSPRGHVFWEEETFSDPRVLLHIPKGFDARRPGLMVIYFHGHRATLERDVHTRQQVPAQITRSGSNAVLVAPQFAVNAADSSAGRFWEPGAFGRFLGEAAQHLAQLHGDRRTVRTFASMPVVIVAYSGGYLPTAWSLTRGGLEKRLRGVVLFDALYGELGIFADWIGNDPSAFFISSYTSSTRGRNAELQRILSEREVAFTTSMPRALRPGSIAFLSTDADTSHNDFVTRAWVDDPIRDLLDRIGGFRR